MPIDFLLGVPNNWCMPPLTASEIVALLGGPAAVARLVNVKQPSVSGWLELGIPEGRMIELAGEIELRAPDRFSRRLHWPDRYMRIWPELADVPAAEPVDRA
jgi:hypothetical protein